MDRPDPDLGRYAVTRTDADRGAFKTPTLRDVARRGPYIHDGSEKTLEDVVAFYNRGGVRNAWDLVAFLRALTGEIDPEVGRPPVLPP